jgi:ribosomal protein L37AE/L43A
MSYRLERFVTVAVYVLPWEAQLAKARLESEGIDSVIADENAAGIYGANAIGGIKVRVREEETERATTVLATLRPIPEIYLVTEEDARRTRCPDCRSEEVAAEGWFRRRWSCRACGATWRDGEPEEPAANVDDAGLVTIARFRTPWEAHLARTLLESCGIDACVLEERLPPLNLLTGESRALNRVEVHPEDADRAAELLAENAAAADDTAAESLPAAD